MMTGSLKKRFKKKRKKKGGVSLIRACSLIRSNTVHVIWEPTAPNPKFEANRTSGMGMIQYIELNQLSPIHVYIW